MSRIALQGARKIALCNRAFNIGRSWLHILYSMILYLSIRTVEEQHLLLIIGKL